MTVNPANGFIWRQLEPRTRQHLRAGYVVRRTGLVRERAKRKWIARAEEFFVEHDVLITPMLATHAARFPGLEGQGLAGQRAALASTHRFSRTVGPRRLSGYVHSRRTSSRRTTHRRPTGSASWWRTAAPGTRSPTRGAQPLVANRASLSTAEPTSTSTPVRTPKLAKVWFVTGASRGLGRSAVGQALGAGHRGAGTSSGTNPLLPPHWRPQQVSYVIWRQTRILR